MIPNSEKIIKALECCAVWGDCKECPYDDMPFNSKNDNCAYHSTTDALSLIKEQQAEIGRLQKYNTDAAFKHYNDGVSDTVKKMQERLKEAVKYIPWCDYPPVHEVIDQITKEILEETK